MNERLVKAVMYVKEKGKITNNEYQDIFKLKKRQATDDLNKLVNMKLIERIGTTGKGTYYILKGRNERKGALKGSKGSQTAQRNKI